MDLIQSESLKASPSQGDLSSPVLGASQETSRRASEVISSVEHWLTETIRQQGKELRDLNAENVHLNNNLIELKQQLQSLQQEYEIYKRNSLPLPVEKSDRLPTVAPILYKDWKKLPENKGKTPLDCLREVYGEYLEKGLLYQDDLRSRKGGRMGGLDPALLNSALTYCYRHNISSEFIPPIKSVRLVEASKKIDHKKAAQIKRLAFS